MTSGVPYRWSIALLVVGCDQQESMGCGLLEQMVWYCTTVAQQVLRYCAAMELGRTWLCQFNANDDVTSTWNCD